MVNLSSDRLLSPALSSIKSMEERGNLIYATSRGTTINNWQQTEMTEIKKPASAGFFLG